jgi:hypothetical protein
METKTL